MGALRTYAFKSSVDPGDATVYVTTTCCHPVVSVVCATLPPTSVAPLHSRARNFKTPPDVSARTDNPAANVPADAVRTQFGASFIAHVVGAPPAFDTNADHAPA